MNALATLIKWVASAGLTGLTTGCARSGTPGDPLEGFNRAVFGFNQGFDQAIVKPVAKGWHAAALGIPINEVSVTLDGTLDLRGFFSVAPHPRAGFAEIVGSVRIDSPASVDQLKRLKDALDAHCPVLDLLRNATPVRIALA